MVIAVMIAVFMMMIFIDPISNFINGHPEMKLLALTFIVAIGALLVIDSIGFHTGIELMHMPLEKLIVYFAMVFCIVLELIQMRYNKALKQYHKEHWQAETAQQLDALKAEMLERLEEEKSRRAEGPSQDEKAPDNTASAPTPIFIGGNVYIMAPVVGQDAASFKRMIEASEEMDAALNEPIEIEAEAVEVEGNDKQ